MDELHTLAEVRARIEALVSVLRLKQKEYSKKFTPMTPGDSPELGIDWGSKYARIWRRDSQTSVYFFVAINTGDVLKAAGWKAPAKNKARSNIWDKDMGVSGIGPYGAHYIVGPHIGW